MRRAALAVLLSLCVPLLLFGQRGGSSTASSSAGSETYHPSSSSSSSSSSGSSSSGSSSSNSGSSHASTSGGSSSGNSGGNSRSSSGEPTASRGGSSSGSGSHPGAGGSVGTHSTSGGSAPRSNIRAGSSDSSSANVRNADSVNRTGSQLYSGTASGNWTEQPVQFHLQNEILGANLDKARQDGKLDADFLRLGLEPNKDAYQQKMADLQAVEKSNSEKPQSRLSKFIFGDREKTSSAAAMSRPCVGKDCPAPKPCPGKNCKPAPAPPPPPAGGLNSGCEYLPPGATQGSSYCQPLGYIDHCDGNGQCYAHLGRVNGPYCDVILNQLKKEQKHAAALLKAQEAACSTSTQDAQCVSATNDYQASQSLIPQLASQYQMCRSAAGLGPANINLAPSVTAQPSTP